MIEIQQVSKRYGGADALKPIDLRVERGKITALIGPSGCGKSTLLRLMIGLILPDSGTIRVAGAELTRDNVRELRHRMGYVIQDGGLFPHLTARANVALLPRYLGWSADRIAARVDELSSLTRLEPAALDRYPAQLSGGQRQRVGLMRALMLDPELLLLDEPFGALDPIIRAELQQDLLAVVRSLKKTCVLVTHDVGEAWYLGGELVLMRDGAIVQQGSFRALLNSPADPFVTQFLHAQRSPIV